VFAALFHVKDIELSELDTTDPEVQAAFCNGEINIAFTGEGTESIPVFSLQLKSKNKAEANVSGSNFLPLIFSVA
jgi:hypothetical protein